LVGFWDQWDPFLEARQTESAHLLGTGPLVISSVVDSWIVVCQNLASDHLVDLEAQVFVVQIHLLKNADLESTFGEAFRYHHTGVDIEMKVDWIGSNDVQVVSEGRYEAVVESLEYPIVRNLEVAAGYKEVYHGEEVVEVFQNRWETREKLDLVVVGMVEAVGRLAAQEQDLYKLQSVHIGVRQSHQQEHAHGNTRLVGVACGDIGLMGH